VDLEEYACIGGLHAPSLHDFFVAQRTLYPYGAPLGPLLYYFWAGLFGTGIVTVRLLSALTGTGLIVLPVLIAREIWPADPRTARRAGLFAALLVALSPVHLYQAQEARMYAFVAFFAALSSLSLLRAVRIGGRRWWLLNLLANAGLVWSHYLAAFLWPAQALFLLFAKGVRWRALFLWLVAHALLLAPVGLWISGIAQQPKELHDYYLKPDLSLAARNLIAGDAVHWSSSTFFPSARAWSFAPDVVREWAVSSHAVGDAAIAVAFSAALLWGLVRCFRRRASAEARTGYLLLWALVPLGLLVLVSFAWKPVYASRFLVHASLALYLLLGGLLALLPTGRRTVCVALLTLVYGWQLSLALPPQTRTAWKQAAAAIRTADGPRTITLIEGVFWKPIYAWNLSSADAVVASLLEPESMAEMGAFLVRAIPALEPESRPACWAVLVDAIHGQAGRFESAAAPYRLHLDRRDYPGERRLDVYRISPVSATAGPATGPPPAALLDVCKVIAEHPNDPAIAAFQESMRAVPDVLGGGYVRLGAALAERGRITLAAAVLDEALARFPAHLVDLVFLERALSGRGEIAPLAERAFEHVKAVPDRIPALRQVLQSLVERKDADGLRDTAERMIRAFPDYPQSYTYLALQYLDDNRIEDSLPLIERAIALDPGQPARLCCTLGNHYMRNDRCPEALKLLEQGLEHEPLTGILILKLAAAHNQCGDADRALALVNGLLQREPASPIALSQRAEILIRLGKWQEAEADATAVAQQFPKSHQCNFLLWRILSLEKKDAEARQLLEKLATCSPGGDFFINKIVDALYARHDRTEGLEKLKKAFEESPLPADILETLDRLCPENQPAAAAEGGTSS